MLTSMHKSEFIDTGKKKRITGEAIQKPSAIVDYNKYMGGVDKNDAMIGNYSSTQKWYKKVFSTSSKNQC